MEPKFLEKVADHLLGLESADLIETVVIFPNKRSEIFLGNYLKIKAKKSLWLSDFLTIDEFMVNTSGLVEMDPINLYFELFEIHKRIAGTEARTLDDFLSWAPIILNDFNDIDLNLADAKKVFTHLSEARALEVWNLNKVELTKLQKNYLAFYQSLYDYYLQLNEVLGANNVGYKGMIYRNLAGFAHEKIEKTNWKRFVLVGFNALSEAEIKVFGHLIENYKVDVLWDLDSFYFNEDSSQKHEAGRFIQKLIKRWKLKDIKWIGNQLSTDPDKKIEILGVPKNIGQVKFAAQKITEWLEKKENHQTQLLDTAIVLADENLLLPMLNSLPDIENPEGNKVGFNITMGYPMTNSPFAHLVTCWLDLLNINSENRLGLFPVAQFVGILNNPILRLATSKEPSENIKQAIDKINGINSAYFSKTQIDDIFQNLSPDGFKTIKNFIAPANKPAEFIDALLGFLERVKFNIDPKSNNHLLLREQMIEMFGLVKKLSSYFVRYESEINFKTTQKIFSQLLRRGGISLKGEPLNGIQVMGMLETRNLDFKNIILLSANEGVLPKSSPIESFLPFDIRRAYHFPLPNDKTDVFAYHFYRLLQQAKNITLVYNSEPENFGGGEMSRFILQLQNELVKANPKIDLSSGSVKIPLAATYNDPGITIIKSDEIMDRIWERTQKGLSPTALASFIKCSLQFYFSYILRLKVSDPSTDAIEANVFGSVVHNVLEKIYQNFENSQIDPAELKKYLPLIDSMVIEEFNLEFKGGNIESGKNLLVVEVAKKYVRQFIESEIKNLTKIPRKLISTEEEKKVAIDVQGHTINLRGRVDRVDEVLGSNTMRIVDYKTGSVQPRDLALKDWEQLTTNPNFEKAFQVLFYTFLFHKNNTIKKEYDSGIISLRNRSHGFMGVNLPDKMSVKDGLAIFEEQLEALIVSLIDTSIPFEQTEDEANCNWCDFKAICNRKGKSFF